MTMQQKVMMEMIGMMVIRNMKRNKNDKIREYAKAEAEHFMDVQRLRKEVQKEAREYKDLINL